MVVVLGIIFALRAKFGDATYNNVVFSALKWVVILSIISFAVLWFNYNVLGNSNE